MSFFSVIETMRTGHVQNYPGARRKFRKNRRKDTIILLKRKPVKKSYAVAVAGDMSRYRMHRDFLIECHRNRYETGRCFLSNAP